MRLRAQWEELQKQRKDAQPGAQSPQENSGELSVDKSASDVAAENGGETPPRAATGKSEQLSLNAAKAQKPAKSKGK